MLALWLTWLAWLSWHFLGCAGEDRRCSTWVGSDGEPLSLCNLKADYGTANAGVAFFGALLIRRVFSIQAVWERVRAKHSGISGWILWLLRYVQLISFAWFTIGMMRKGASSEELYAVHSGGSLVYYLSVALYYGLVLFAFGACVKSRTFLLIGYFLLYFITEQTIQLAVDYKNSYPWSRIIVQSSMTVAIPFCSSVLLYDIQR